MGCRNCVEYFDYAQLLLERASGQLCNIKTERSNVITDHVIDSLGEKTCVELLDIQGKSR